MIKIGEWRLIYNKSDMKNYWNTKLKQEVGIGKTWNISKKKQVYAVAVYYSPNGRFSNKGVKLKRTKQFATKKQAQKYKNNYMKKNK